MNDEDERQFHELHGKLQKLGVRISAKLTSMLLYYTEETLGLAVDKLPICLLPYKVETYFLGIIRLVSIQKNYVPYIPEFFHSNIVAQYGLLVSKDNEYFLMLENTIGKSFQEHLEENTPTEEINVLWVRDVSDGLHYLHSLNFWYGELSLDRMYTHGSTLKLEHPAVCERYGQGVEQDLQELCKLIKKISKDKRLKRLSENIGSGAIKSASEVCRYLEANIPRNTNFPRFDFPEDVADVEPMEVNRLEEEDSLNLKNFKEICPIQKNNQYQPSAKKLSNMSVRPASEDHVVPTKEARTLFVYHPELEVATMTVDPDLDNYAVNALGKFEALQTVEHSVQGYYLLCKNLHLREYSGPVLVKYLGGRNEIIRQLRDYYGVGVSAGVATQIRLAKDKKNPERQTFAKELFHENIVRILGFISPNGKPENINAIIMEGDFDGTLEDYASRKQIPLPLVKAFALQLASALEYCHSLGIMHRDVRARNIYVQDGMKIKLGNFDYARVGDKDDIYTSKYVSEGEGRYYRAPELYYRAPEMISSHAVTEYTVSVDVYGFALVLWSMLHGGKKPYKDDPACERLVRNETMFKRYLENGNRPRIDDNVDQGLMKLIEECWINETEIDKRPSMSSVVQTLQPNIYR